MGCKQLTCRADGGGAANANSGANSVGPAPDGSYALYSPEHIANVVKRARTLVSDAIHAMWLRDESKGVLLTVASEHLAFLDAVMADSLPVLNEARFRKRFSPCACGRETSGRSDSPKPSNPPKPSKPPKAKGGRHG